jgi:hypothetical protein
MSAMQMVRSAEVKPTNHKSKGIHLVNVSLPGSRFMGALLRLEEHRM